MTEYIAVAAELTAYSYTVAASKKTMVATTVQIVVEVVVVLIVVGVVVVSPFDGLLPSHSTCPLFCPGVDHMHNNPYLHVQ